MPIYSQVKAGRFIGGMSNEKPLGDKRVKSYPSVIDTSYAESDQDSNGADPTSLISSD